MTQLSIGPYDLTRCLGRGGMAEVWEARTDSGPVAVKIITTQFTNSTMYRSAFENEVRAVASLLHPGIIGVLDYGRDPLVRLDGESRLVPAENSHWLAMELVPGGPIDGVDGLTWERLKGMLHQLLDALGHAHANGVVHRDLKPDNVLFSSSPSSDEDVPLPRPILTDFGIARATAEQSSEQFGLDTTTGTPAYMAPEQVRGHHRMQGPWTDLYAFGCLVFRLVTGSPPYSGASAHEVMRGHLADPLPLLTPRMDVPEKLSLWLRKLLAKEPQHRFQRASDAARSLAELGPPVPDSATLIARSAGTEQPTVISTPRSGGEQGAADTAPREERDDRLVVPPPVLPELEGEEPRRWQRSGLGLFGLRRVPLVGREELCQSLWEALRTTHEKGEASAVVLQGPSGVGKSKVARWLAEQAHSCGVAEVFFARHSPLGGQASGLPGLVSHHTQAVGLERIDAEEHLFAMAGLRGIELDDVPVLVDLVSPALSNDAGVRIGSAIERYLAVARLMIASSRPQQRTAVVWLDDVQWGADGLAFCDFVLSKLGDVAIFFVLTAQSEALAHQDLERKLLEELCHKQVVTGHQLGPLDTDAQRRLVADWLGLEPGLAAEIVARTEGNPLFALQLVGGLVNRGSLEASPSGFVAQDTEGEMLPEDLRSLWLSRLEQLADMLAHDNRDELFTVLELAAVLGQEVDHREWEALCRDAELAIPQDLVRRMVDGRLAVDIRTASRAHGWGFEHGLLRETLLEHAGLQERLRDHHSRCARVLGQLYPEGYRGAAERIGRHYLLAGEYELSLAPLLDAAEALQVTSDFRQAEELLDLRDSALSALQTRPADSRRIQGDLLRARCQMKRAQPDAANELVGAVITRARVMGMKSVEGESWALRGMIFNRQGKLDEAEEAFSRALEISEALGDSEWVARSLHGLAYVQLWRGRFEEVLPASRRAVEFFEDAGRPHEVGHALVTTSVALRRTGDADGAEEVALRALASFDKAGTRYGQAMAHNELGENYRHSEKLGFAEEHYRKAYEIMESVGSKDASVMRANLGTVLRERGRVSEAIEMLSTARDEFEASGQRVYLGLVDVELTLCAGLTGAWDLWDRYGEDACDKIATAGIVDGEVAANAERLVRIALDAGERERAAPFIELALAQWEALSDPDGVERVKALKQTDDS